MAGVPFPALTLSMRPLISVLPAELAPAAVLAALPPLPGEPALPLAVELLAPGVLVLPPVLLYLVCRFVSYFIARLEVFNLKVFNLVRMFKSIDYHTPPETGRIVIHSTYYNHITSPSTCLSSM
jgi:hypothetical protein